MPPDGYESITVPVELLNRLDEYRTNDGGRAAYAGVIGDLLDTVEAEERGVTREDLRRLEEHIERVPDRVVDQLHADLR